ncbi:MAG TPA: hypothetical protein QGH10_20030, partial [Armatimonadota bacterium]|nr:hypothetical protein [Armatimonadota bacterium]
MRLLLGLVLAAASTAHAETRLYVATDGDDAGAGTEASPFGTLHRARDAARAVDDEVRISVGEGTHYLSEPLVLGPEDSNTVWEAREGENVVLSGGRPVEGWERDGDVWAADVDASDWVFRQLFVDGRRAIRARYPNFDESDVVTKGWLRARQPEGYGIILAGIAKQGDFLEYELDVPADGAYDLWASYATISDGARRGVRMLIDGEEITLPDMPASGSWRKTVWCETPAVELTEG